MAIDSTVAEPEAGEGASSPPAAAALSSPSTSSSLAPGAVGRPARPPSGEKARRIVEAMRTSVARRGTVGSTFDHGSREAGRPPGLLPYYFRTKGRLLLQAARHGW